jgi:hypothetical protein
MIAVYAIIVLVCFTQFALSKRLGVFLQRTIPALPFPVRRFYEVTSLGRRWDSDFWNRGRQFVAGIVGIGFSIMGIVEILRRY